MSAIQKQIDQGAVASAIANICPKGTKFHVLEVGWLECDEAFIIRGANISLMSNKDKPSVHKRRQLPLYCILIEHPHEGLILWETGCGKDYPEVWGPVMSDAFARVRYEPKHELDAAIAATGNRIEDVKRIIIGHLHLDHAGGLDWFLHREDIEIWVHDRELKSALWSAATGADSGVYLERYLKLGL
jgi:glyoxylase-like metal-dependent hydrolase (beta-lactamase superfamily II)